MQYCRNMLWIFAILFVLWIPMVSGATTESYNSTIPAFGEEMRAVEFPHLLSNISFLNHASYGFPSKQVIDEQMAIIMEYYSDPDNYNRRLSSGYWEEANAAAASFFGTTPERIVLTTSTTDSINSVLQSLPFVSGDAILQNNFTYEGMRNIIVDVASKTPGVSVITLNHVYPIASTQQIIDEYTTILDTNPNIKLAFIDHISSKISIMFPIEQLIGLCKSRGIIVCIDGAHALGQVNLNLDTLGADFYAGSLHKWVFGLRGSGILYSAPQYDDIIKPNLVSYDHVEPFPECFKEQGTRDTTPLYAAVKSMEFYNSIGGLAAISNYNIDLGNRMADMLASAWGTTRFDIPPEMESPFIKMVFVPYMPNYPLDDDGNRQLQHDIHDIYGIWTSMAVFDGSFLLRLSTQIYCVENDYFRLRDAVLSLQVATAKAEQGDRIYKIHRKPTQNTVRK